MENEAAQQAAERRAQSELAAAAATGMFCYNMSH